MKRIRSACILQTVVFSQKPEADFPQDIALKINREEFDRYKAALERARTKYIITDVSEEENGSVVVHIKKQYNNNADVSEYF